MNIEMNTKIILSLAIVAALALVGAVAVEIGVVTQQASADSANGPFHGCKQGSDAFRNTDKQCIHRD
jgi:hypothetical protein